MRNESKVMVNKMANSQSHTLIGILDTGFSADAFDLDDSKVYLGSDLIDGNENPLLVEGNGNHHGSYILRMLNILDTQSLWLGRAVGSGRWAESLIEFVDTVQASGHRNAVVNLSFDP
jgi:hypothetical protein